MSLGEFLGHMQELGMKFKRLGVVARPEKETLFFNSCKSKTRLKIIKTWHGVMTWHQHAAGIFLAELGQALV